jgi:ABC-type methionine transport system ATPase subunit
MPEEENVEETTEDTEEIEETVEPTEEKPKKKKKVVRRRKTKKERENPLTTAVRRERKGRVRLKKGNIRKPQRKGQALCGR